MWVHVCHVFYISAIWCVSFLTTDTHGVISSWKGCPCMRVASTMSQEGRYMHTVISDISTFAWREFILFPLIALTHADFKLLGNVSSKQRKTVKQRGGNEWHKKKHKGEEKLINCQRLLGFAECIHQYRDSTPFRLWGQEKWKMLDIFQSGNHRPKPPFEVININLSWPSFKLNKRYGPSSSVLHNKLIPSGPKRRTKRGRRGNSD